MEAIQLLGLETPWTMAERGDLEGMQMVAAVDHTLDFDRPDLAQARVDARHVRVVTGPPGCGGMVACVVRCRCASRGT